MRPFHSIESMRNRSPKNIHRMPTEEIMYTFSDDPDMNTTTVGHTASYHDDYPMVIQGDIYNVPNYSIDVYDVDNPSDSDLEDSDEEAGITTKTYKHLETHSTIYSSSQDTALVLLLLVFIMLIIVCAMGLHMILHR